MGTTPRRLLDAQLQFLSGPAGRGLPPSIAARDALPAWIRAGEPAGGRARNPLDPRRLLDVADLVATCLERGTVLFHELVTHGDKSGGRMANSFSNENGSNKSSIGLAKTAETYHSTKFNGTSLRIDGLERGFNSNMRERAIVMHPATYATPEAIEENRRAGEPRLGRSQGLGCALRPDRSGSQLLDAAQGVLGALRIAGLGLGERGVVVGGGLEGIAVQAA